MTYACIVIAFTHKKEEKNRVKKEELKSKVIKKETKPRNEAEKEGYIKMFQKKDKKIEKKISLKNNTNTIFSEIFTAPIKQIIMKISIAWSKFEFFQKFMIVHYI